MGRIVLFFCFGLVSLGVFLILTKLFLLVALGAIIIAVAIYLLLGLRSVQEQERRVVELFGRFFMTLKPGLQWLLPGAMKIRATISVWEQGIPLFTDQPARIVVKDGIVIPKGAKVFVKLRSPDEEYEDLPDPGKKPICPATPTVSPPIKPIKESGAYRAIYKTPQWREFIEDLIENTLRSHLGKFVIDDLVIEGKGGFDLADHEEEVGLPNNILARIEAKIANWGWDLLRVTVTEFQLTPEEAKARQEVQIKKKQAEAAEFEKQKMARETMGTLIQMVSEATGDTFKEIQDIIKTTPVLLGKIVDYAHDLVTRRMSGDVRALTDFRVSGAGGSKKDKMDFIAELVLLWKKKQEGGKKKEREEEKEEED